MSKTAKLIALSAGGDDRELAAHGLGMEHVNELMVRLARQLLRDNHRLAFGGALGVPDAELTEMLISAALGWLSEDMAESADVRHPSSWPLVNYTGWPHDTLITPQRQAALVGVCQFVSVPPRGVKADELDALSAAGGTPEVRLEMWHTDLMTRRYMADALTRMRKLLTRCTALRMVWGGRIRGAAGWMAGIAEEVLLSLQLGRPVLILGGFGGCAKLLADFLVTPDADWPCELTLEGACTDQAYEALIDYAARRDQLAACYNDLRQRLTALQTQIEAGQDIYGVSADLFRQALTDDSARRAIRLAGDFCKQLG